MRARIPTGKGAILGALPAMRLSCVSKADSGRYADALHAGSRLRACGGEPGQSHTADESAADPRSPTVPRHLQSVCGRQRSQLDDWTASSPTVQSHGSVSLYAELFTARCYASAVLDMGLCLSVCLSVTSRCSIETAERIELDFGM